MTYKYKDDEVFRMLPKASPSTVRKRYLDKRLNDETFWCDIESCQLHEKEPIWNDSELSLHLDHLSGDRNDNRIDEDNNVGARDIERQLRSELRLRSHVHARKIHRFDPRSYDAAGAVV